MHAQADSRTGSASALRKARWVYVGSRTERERNAQGEGISIYRIDTSTGEWALSEVAGGMVNPSFLAFDRTGRDLYTVHGKHSGITAFRVDRHTGRLTRIGHQPTEVNPVHLAPDPTNRYMVVANLDSGSLASLPIHADGTLGPMSDVVKLSGKPGSGRARQPGSGPHHCPPDRSGRFIVVPDKGLDKVFVFRLDAATGKLIANDPPHAVSQPGAGPRHVDFHPNGSWAYVVNELDSTVTAYRLDTQSGALTTLQTLSTLPPDFRGENSTAEIYLTPNGKFVYASNRGHDSLAVFAVDQASGALTLAGWVPAQGKKPRYFGLDPTGKFLYVANEDSHTVVTFRVDQESGTLTPTGQVVKVGSPVCIVFAGYEI
ncbi:MAG: lactonase family protein [Betaproteobacteria bacterium]|nr:lactonase family protein [Betaproteobacteria bacterium]